MIRNKYLFGTFAVASLLCCETVSAQALRSGYFLDGYNYRHEINPAIGNEQSYFAIPIIGNLNVETNGNIAIENLLFTNPNNSNELVLFMDKSVDTESFLSNIEKNNLINLNLDMPIISFGFKAGKGYNTVGINLHSFTGINLPYELLEFAKRGLTSNKSYDINDLNISSSSYIEIGLGHSRNLDKLLPGLRVGAKLKYLIGIAYANVNVNNLHVDMGSDGKTWNIKADAIAETALGGSYEYEHSKYGDVRYVSGYDYNDPTNTGSGFAVDFGATYDASQWVDGLSASFAFTDLGFVNWKMLTAKTANNSWTFDGFDHTISAYDEAKNGTQSLKGQSQNLRDDLYQLMEFHEDAGTEGTTTNIKKSLPSTFTFGLEYRIPYVKNKISVGYLFTNKAYEIESMQEHRLSLNLLPCKWFDASVSAAAQTYGNGFGAVLNFHPTGINLFVGADYTFNKVSKQYIPIENSNASFNLGMNITFGKKTIRETVRERIKRNTESDEEIIREQDISTDDVEF